ncbi:MAG TPA: DUF3515 family protein [Micromonosporaceae bacterium]
MGAASGGRHSPHLVATLVAIPAAVAAGVAALWAFGVFSGTPGPIATPTGPPATSAVRMAAPALTADTQRVCQAVIAALPDRIRDRARRPVTAGAEQNAAYGDPPVTLACGTPMPSFPPTAMVSGLSGVCWFAEPGTGATRWTTVDRAVPVTVTVPGRPDGSAHSVIPFSAPISAADPVAARVPTGCNP